MKEIKFITSCTSKPYVIHTMKEIKFMWNGIKIDGKLYRAWYSIGNLVHYPSDTVTIYGKDYDGFPEIEGLTIHNDSDMRTDYFEKDRIRVMNGNRYYQAIIEALNQMKTHNNKRWNKSKYGQVTS
jgi:hypothetical protein